jgi:chemotaxis family two-component system sensor kinase Cph1
VVKAEFTQLVRLFENLIGNAVKYRRDVVPEIHVSATRHDDEWLFCVSDNGAGFNPVYADRIFGIFQRLHGSDKPGSGVGLAVCRKIVERYGGRIWAESEPGVGSRFWFTIASPT